MLNTIDRNKFLQASYIDPHQISEWDEGFSVIFDFFHEVAGFFNELGKTALSNENANTTSDRGFYLDDADGLARDAELETVPGHYLVTFPGWKLT